MNKKKGYPRNPYSFERVLKDLADDIGYENIETVIEKKRKDQLQRDQPLKLNEDHLLL